MKIGHRGRAVLGIVLLGLTACGTAAELPAGSGTSSSPPSASSFTPDPESYAGDLFALTNAARAAEGLERLKPSACAEEVALERADALVGRALDHAPLQPVLDQCGTDAAAENLVDSASPPQDVVDAWMDSPGHRNNIVESRWAELGVSCVPHDGEFLCAQIFLAPTGR